MISNWGIMISVAHHIAKSQSRRLGDLPVTEIKQYAHPSDPHCLCTNPQRYKCPFIQVFSHADTLYAIKLEMIHFGLLSILFNLSGIEPVT